MNDCNDILWMEGGWSEGFPDEVRTKNPKSKEAKSGS
jgi:hypothetical protein